MKIFYASLSILCLLSSFAINAESVISTSVSVNTIGLADSKISIDSCWDKIPECQNQKIFFSTLDISTQQKLCNSFTVKESKCDLTDASTVKSILKSAVIAFNTQVNSYFAEKLLTKSKIVDLQVASAQANSSTEVNTEATFKQSGKISNRYAKLSKKLSQVIFEKNFSVITSAPSSVSSISLQSSTDGKVQGVNLLYRQDDISDILDLIDEIDVKEEIESEINSSITIDAIQKIKQKDPSTFKNKSKQISIACNSITDTDAKSICVNSKACKSSVFAKCSSNSEFTKCAADFYADSKNTDECTKADKVIKETADKISSNEQKLKQLIKDSAKLDISALSTIKANAKTNAKNTIESQKKMIDIAKNLAESIKSALSDAFNNISNKSSAQNSASNSQSSNINASSSSESAVESQKSETVSSSASTSVSESASASVSVSEAAVNSASASVSVSEAAVNSASASVSVSEAAVNSASASVSVSEAAVNSASASVSVSEAAVNSASASVSVSEAAVNSASASVSEAAVNTSTRNLQNEIILNNNVNVKQPVIASDMLSNMEKIVTTALSNMETVIATNKSDIDALIATNKSELEVIATNKSDIEVIATNKSEIEELIAENKSNIEAVISANKSDIEVIATNNKSLIDSLKSADVETSASIQTLTPSTTTTDSPTPYDNIESSFGTTAEATLLIDLYNKLVIQSQKSNSEKIQNALNNLIGLFLSKESINARTPLNLPCFIKTESARKTIEDSFNSSIVSTNTGFSFTTYTNSEIISDSSNSVESNIQLKVENKSFEITVANIDAIKVLLISRINLDGTIRTSLKVKSSTLEFDYQTKSLVYLNDCLTNKESVSIDCSYLPDYSSSQVKTIISALSKLNFNSSSNKCLKTKEERMTDSSLALKFKKVYFALIRSNDIKAYLDCFLLSKCDKTNTEVSSLRLLATSSYTYAKGSEPDTTNSQVTFEKSDISDSEFTVAGSTPSVEAESTTSLSAAINADATTEAQAEAAASSSTNILKISMFLVFLLVLIL